MKNEIESTILGPETTRIVLPDFVDELTCINAILDGSIGVLPWAVDPKGENFTEEPICAGHIYGQPANRGPQPAPVMVIGKLPRPADIADDKTGDPGGCFHPKSHAGKYFNTVAAEFGVDPSTWYVTYLFKTLHPEDANKGSRLKATWLKEAFPVLQYEITQVGPSYILVFGAEAVKSLFGHKAKITDLTGTVLDYEYVDYNGHQQTAKCVCCTSPHAVTRSSDAEESAKYYAAFQLFVNLLNNSVPLEQCDHRTIRTLAEWKDLLATIRTECTDRVVAIDAEWSGQHPQNSDFWIRTIQFSWAHGKAAALIIRESTREDVFSPEDLQIIKEDFFNLWLGDYIICGHYLDSDTEGLVGEGFIKTIYDLPYIPATPEEYKQRIKARKPCLFDTAIAAHAYCETDDHSLTGQFMLRCPTVPRYDSGLDIWKKEYCKAHKIKEKELNGFGPCPDDIIVYYGCYDADVTRRIALYYMEHLEKDAYGLDCWEAFSNSMQQWPAFLEMNCTGLLVDRGRMDDLMSLYSSKAESLEKELKAMLKWPGLNINSPYQLREALYGEKYNGSKTGKALGPKNSIQLKLEPIYATDGTPWATILEKYKKGEEILSSPSCNSRSLSMLTYKYDKLFNETGNEKHKFSADVTSKLRHLKLLKKTLSYVLKGGLVDEDGGEAEPQGLSAYICDDGRIRTHLYCTLDSGRAASARPAMQNLSKKREADYQVIVGGEYIAPLRSILVAPPGHMLISADFLGAELFACAVLSGDAKMLDHVSRNQLPEDDPNFYDIHSQIAVSAFKLNCEPTKTGLKSIGKVYLRVVAKSVIFGMMYGRGAAAIAEAVREENVFITVDEAKKIIESVARTYPKAMDYLRAAADAVFDPGYIIGVCGRPRRIPVGGHLPDDKLADLQRIFKNFPEQNFVAEAMRMALKNLYDWRFEHDDFFEICLQVHDEVLLCAPYEHVANIVDHVLPECMVNNVKLFPRDLRGNIITDRGPYSMGVDISVGKHYSVKDPDWREIVSNI